MKSLAQASFQQEIAARIAALTPGDCARWGRMNVHQMMRHVADAYRVPMGEIAITPPKMPIPPAVMKFAALRVPLKWRPGFPSPPEIAQDQQGAPPVEFELDRADLLAVFGTFCTRCPGLGGAHAFFGPMSGRDWQRWGYLHADHHLRQFGR